MSRGDPGVLARLASNRVDTLLRDGPPALCRPIGREDRQVIREGFDSLSERSRIRRFLVPTSVLTEHELGYLTQIDYPSVLALESSPGGLAQVTLRGVDV